MKKGFTLIELLAVIVILAIIALIATPIVLNIINDTKESAVLRSAEFYIDAVEFAIANRILKGDPIPNGTYDVKEGDICFDADCTDKLEVETSGEKPTGKLEIIDGTIGYVDLTISNNIVTSNASGELVNGYTTICTGVKTATTGNVPSGAYNPGDEYLCEVKPGTSYRFFVLGEDEIDSSKVNLIMYANINGKGVPVDSNDVTEKLFVEWINKEDYVLNKGNSLDWDATCYETDWTESGLECSGFNDKGPVTAIKFLNDVTKDWSNIANLNEVYNDINGHYTNFKLTGKARLPKITELKKTGCTDNDSGLSCPIWISNYLCGEMYEGSTQINNTCAYWTMDTYAGSQDAVYGVYFPAFMYWPPAGNADDGVRPVITVSKNNIK